MNYDECVCDAYIYDLLPWLWWIYLWFLIHDPDAYMHVSTMQISMILDPDACIYDAANLFRTNERTDEQGDSRSWIVNSLRSHDRLGSIPAKPGGHHAQFVSAELSEC